jgi:hypothetical protein
MVGILSKREREREATIIKEILMSIEAFCD